MEYFNAIGDILAVILINLTMVTMLTALIFGWAYAIYFAWLSFKKWRMGKRDD